MTARVNVRADVDENNSWRVRPKTEAIACVRGDTLPELKNRTLGAAWKLKGPNQKRITKASRRNHLQILNMAISAQLKVLFLDTEGRRWRKPARGGWNPRETHHPGHGLRPWHPPPQSRRGIF